MLHKNVLAHSGFRTLDETELAMVGGGTADALSDLAAQILEMYQNRCLYGPLGSECREEAVNDRIQSLITDGEEHEATAEGLIYFEERDIYAQDSDGDGEYDRIWNFTEGNGWRINEGDGWKNTSGGPLSELGGWISNETISSNPIPAP